MVNYHIHYTYSHTTQEPTMKLNTKYHEDGTVTFWSVYEQRWINHAQRVPDRELAAMPTDEREEVKAFLRAQNIDE